MELTNIEFSSLAKDYKNLLDALNIEPPKDAEKLLSRFIKGCLEKLWETSDAKIGSFNSRISAIKREAVFAKEEAKNAKEEVKRVTQEVNDAILNSRIAEISHAKAQAIAEINRVKTLAINEIRKESAQRSNTMHDAIEDFMLQMEKHGLDVNLVDNSLSTFIHSMGHLEYQHKKTSKKVDDDFVFPPAR